jgi:hypothetical protein
MDARGFVPNLRAIAIATSLIACARCGGVDQTLRSASFWYIVSLIVISFRRGGAAVLCASCRRYRAIEYSAISVLAGWWGIPWGIVWTLHALANNLRGGGQDRRTNAIVLALAGRELNARGESLRAADAHNAALALDADAARAALEAVDNPVPVALAAPAPTGPWWKRQTRLEWVRIGIVAIVVALVVGVGVQPYIARAIPHPVVVPSQPPGGSVVQTDDFAIALLPKWESIAMDAATFDQNVAAIERRQPDLTIRSWAKTQLDAGMRLAAVYSGPEAAQFNFIPAVTLQMLEYRGSRGFAGVADETAAALASDSAVAKPVDRRTISLPGGTAELFHYKVNVSGTTLDVTRFVLFDPDRGYAYQLRFETSPAQARPLAAQIAEIAKSFRIPSSPR